MDSGWPCPFKKSKQWRCSPHSPLDSCYAYHASLVITIIPLPHALLKGGCGYPLAITHAPCVTVLRRCTRRLRSGRNSEMSSRTEKPKISEIYGGGPQIRALRRAMKLRC